MSNHTAPSDRLPVDGDAAAGSHDASSTPEVDWSSITPWVGKAQRADKVLLGTMFGIVALMIATIPLTPFLIADNPVALEFLRGNLVTVGAAAAFARVGEIPLWLVVFAGTVGMAKLDWLFWVCGRRWGRRVIKNLAPSERVQKALDWLGEHPVLMGLAVIIAPFPGIPAAAIYGLAGAVRMKLASFLVLNVISSALMAGLITWVGYSLGQHAVDVVVQVDKYAMWISMALVIGLAFVATRRSNQAQKARAAERDDAAKDDAAQAAPSES